MRTAEVIDDATPAMTGIIVPLVTPLQSTDAVDYAALELLLERVISGGVSGIFLLSTCGEGASLSYRLRRELIAHTCRQVNGRVPVLVSITDTSAAETRAIAIAAAEAGANVAVLAPPYYLPLSQAELTEYVLRRIDECPLPLMLYNMPELTKVAIAPTTVRRLMDERAIIGLKDSSGDLDYFAQLCALRRHRAEWTLLMGPEHLLVESVELGGNGGVCGGANLFPELFVGIYKAAASDRRRLPELLATADRLGEIYLTEPPSAASVIKGLKQGLACLGLGNGRAADPLGEVATEDKARIQAIMKQLANA
jgi:4-hydroxy-tetrahydrodipicolinate synthase